MTPLSVSPKIPVVVLVGERVGFASTLLLALNKVRKLTSGEESLIQSAVVELGLYLLSSRGSAIPGEVHNGQLAELYGKIEAAIHSATLDEILSFRRCLLAVELPDEYLDLRLLAVDCLYQSLVENGVLAVAPLPYRGGTCPYEALVARIGSNVTPGVVKLSDLERFLTRKTLSIATMERERIFISGLVRWLSRAEGIPLDSEAELSARLVVLGLDELLAYRGYLLRTWHSGNLTLKQERLSTACKFLRFLRGDSTGPDPFAMLPPMRVGVKRGRKRPTFPLCEEFLCATLPKKRSHAAFRSEVWVLLDWIAARHEIPIYNDPRPATVSQLEAAVVALDEEEILLFRRYLLSKKAPGTADNRVRYFRTAKHFLDWLLATNKIGANPAQGVPKLLAKEVFTSVRRRKQRQPRRRYRFEFPLLTECLAKATLSQYTRSSYANTIWPFLWWYAEHTGERIAYGSSPKVKKQFAEKVCACSREDLLAYRQHLLGLGAEFGVIEYRFRVIRIFFSTLHKQGKIPLNPGSSINPIRKREFISDNAPPSD